MGRGSDLDLMRFRITRLCFNICFCVFLFIHRMHAWNIHGILMHVDGCLVQYIAYQQGYMMAVRATVFFLVSRYIVQCISHHLGRVRGIFHRHLAGLAATQWIITAHTCMNCQVMKERNFPYSSIKIIASARYARHTLIVYHMEN